MSRQMDVRHADRMTELLCSRLCHDLVSPVGAIKNGVEFIAGGDQEILSDAISLIGSSAQQATARLTFFRLAFGGWGSEPSVDFGIVRNAVEGYAAEKKCPVTWAHPVPADQVAIDKGLGKLILNLVLVAGDCAQREAQMQIAVSSERHGVSVAVSGARCKLRDDVRSGFDMGISDDGLTVRNIVAHHCRRLADSMNLDLVVADEGRNSVEFAAT